MTGINTRIFLIRGLARESRHWGSFPDLLSSLSENTAVYPLEIPGTGTLSHQKSPSKASEYIPLMRRQFLSMSQSGSNNIIIGLSFGGMIAAEWVKQYRDDFQAAVLINTSGRQSPLLKRIRLRSLLTLLKTLVIQDPFKREKVIASLVCNSADIDEVSLSWAQIRESAPISGHNLLLQLYSAATFSFPEKLEIPLFIICSSKDRLVSPECSEVISRSQSAIATITMHPSAGHDLTTDDPEWFISRLKSWLARL